MPTRCVTDWPTVSQILLFPFSTHSTTPTSTSIPPSLLSAFIYLPTNHSTSHSLTLVNTYTYTYIYIKIYIYIYKYIYIYIFICLFVCLFICLFISVVWLLWPFGVLDIVFHYSRLVSCNVTLL